MSRIARAVAVLAGLCVALLVAETAVRVFSLAPELEDRGGNYIGDAAVPFRRKPFSRQTGRNPTDEFDYDYHHNALGFRDLERSPAKERGVFRILALGDSFTYGVGVSFADTYLQKLEARLNGRSGEHPTVEVINMGLPRYFPEPERIVLETYGVRFEPDLVLVAFLPNDVVDTYFGLDAITVDRSGNLLSAEAAELGDLGVALYRRCHVCRIALRRYVDWRIERAHPVRFDEIFRDGGFHEGDWLGVEREYTKIAEIADSTGADVVFFHIPQRGPWSDRHSYPGARLSRWAGSRGVGFLDLLPAMKGAASSGPLYYEKDGHCTAAAHAVIADGLYGYLTEHRVVP